ncbi:NUDIX domain-containing protein [Mollisia scopiformis]|uniref:NUDIX domain-containing protein n=1 Tax=Mollisia scopiformis TaxID=149040 RepID=A0A132BA45_MOLSC|nr:NUDIX domain-containing protein [Mollisia scopiformis]KUJ09276.1 NUDIX domain-containing protein [Mollisia scopiformis]
MATFKITEKGMDVEVKLVEDLTKEELLEFPAFKNWLTRLTHSLSLQESNPSHPFHKSPYALKSLTIQSFTRFPHPTPRLGFLSLTASLLNTKNESLPGSIFLRGPSVGMLCLLSPRDNPAEKWAIMTIQARPAAGSLAFCELPAGMVDGGGTFAGAAAKEIKEEVGFVIEERDLVNLSELAGRMGGAVGRGEEGLEWAMWPSAGGCDEFIPLFLCEKRVERADLETWTGRLTGLRDEGEKITLKLVKLEDLWWDGARDAKALGALALYDGLKRSGKL